jgi:preprotein translocase subunit YajC
MLVPMMLCIVVFWLIVVRPEKKNRKVREEMLGGLKKGDPVVTSGGIHGSVVGVKDEVVTIQVADGVRMRFSIHAVQTLVSKDTDEKESD